MFRIASLVVFTLGLAIAAHTQPGPELAPPLPEAPPPGGFMSADRLGAIVLSVDPEAEDRGNGYIFKLSDRDMMIVHDEAADRMRIVTPIGPATNLPDELLERMLQANYDAVLDARYAIANGLIWAAYIHPLSTLDEDELLSGMAQTAIAAETFGSTFTSGVVVFGGGDSQNLHEDLVRQLEELSGEDDDRGI